MRSTVFDPAAEYYGWTLGDGERRAAAGAIRAWAVERYGPLGGSHTVETTITWRAYDVA